VTQHKPASSTAVDTTCVTGSSSSSSVPTTAASLDTTGVLRGVTLASQISSKGAAMTQRRRHVQPDDDDATESEDERDTVYDAAQQQHFNSVSNSATATTLATASPPPAAIVTVTAAATVAATATAAATAAATATTAADLATSTAIVSTPAASSATVTTPAAAALMPSTTVSAATAAAVVALATATVSATAATATATTITLNAAPAVAAAVTAQQHEKQSFIDTIDMTQGDADVKLSKAEQVRGALAMVTRSLMASRRTRHGKAKNMLKLTDDHVQKALSKYTTDTVLKPHFRERANNSVHKQVEQVFKRYSKTQPGQASTWYTLSEQGILLVYAKELQLLVDYRALQASNDLIDVLIGKYYQYGEAASKADMLEYVVEQCAQQQHSVVVTVDTAHFMPLLNSIEQQAGLKPHTCSTLAATKTDIKQLALNSTGHFRRERDESIDKNSLIYAMYNGEVFIYDMSVLYESERIQDKLKYCYLTGLYEQPYSMNAVHAMISTEWSDEMS
jgi:hypothetical protein